MPKRSWNREDFLKAINNNFSYSSVARELGLTPVGGNIRTIKSYIKKWDLNISHFKGQGWNRGHSRYQTLEDVKHLLVEKGSYGTTSLKKLLIRLEVLKNECYECGQGSEWRSKPLVLVLDHINGIPDDHRLENLRMLCPNCDSQQSTFKIGSRGNKGNRIEPPSKEEFEEDYYTMSTGELCAKYEVNVGTIYKWVRTYGVQTKSSKRAGQKPSKERLASEYRKFGIEKCSKMYGVRYETFRAWLLKYSIIQPYEDCRVSVHPRRTHPRRSYPRRPLNECQSIGCTNKVKKHGNKTCSYECGHKNTRRVEWPSKEELQELVDTKPMTTVGKMFGVSDNAIRKWCKKYEIVPKFKYKPNPRRN